MTMTMMKMTDLDDILSPVSNYVLSNLLETSWEFRDWGSKLLKELVASRRGSLVQKGRMSSYLLRMKSA